MKLQKLKKLNLKGCAVQLDEATAIVSKTVQDKTLKNLKRARELAA
jgi:hypothetical protein